MRFDEPLGGAEVGDGGPERDRFAVGERVVGQDPLDGDPVGRVPGRGSAQESGAGRAFLVGKDLRVGQPGVVVDGGVDVVVADATAFDVLAAAVSAPAAAVGDPADLLDVDVDQFAGMGAFVALPAVPVCPDELAGERVAVGQPRYAVAAQDPPACRGGYCRAVGESGRPAPPPLSGRYDPTLEGGRCRGRGGVWPAGPVMQTGVALGFPAGDPAVGALPGHAQFLGDVRDGAALDTNTLNQQPAAMHGQPGVTVGHEDLQVLVKSANSTSPGGPFTINYLTGVSPT